MTNELEPSSNGQDRLRTAPQGPGTGPSLSAAEKALRDQELIESANKYFGGLSDAERSALGLDSAVPAGASAGPLTGTEAALPAADGKKGIAEWAWAGSTLAVFLAVVWWVLKGR